MDSDICIIIPCYNEEKRLPVPEFTDFISKNNIHFCFVNDGSIDKTLKVLENIKNAAPEKVRVYNLPKNLGKGEAIREAAIWVQEKGLYTYIGYFDADLATPLSEIDLLYLPFTKNSDYKLIMGSRIKLLGRNVVRSERRHYLGRVFATFASMVLKLPVYDTQCGAKVFKADLVSLIFKDKFVEPWLFDMELIARITKLVGHENAEKHIIEVPLNNWAEIKGSKVRIFHVLGIVLGLIKIARKY